MAPELEKISKIISKTQSSGNPLDEEELKEMIATLTQVLSDLLADQQKYEVLEEKIITLEAKSRSQEDISDCNHQRTMLGKFTITAPLPSSSSQSSSIILDREELKEAGKSLPDHILELLDEKFGIIPDPSDIRLCYHTKRGIVFALQDLKHNSSFAAIVDAIKTGKGKAISSHYVNFSTTPKRSSILFELRKLRKANKIWKFYSDFDGEISFVKDAPLPGAPKIKTRITNVDPRGAFKTLSIQEIKDIFNQDS